MLASPDLERKVHAFLDRDVKVQRRCSDTTSLTLEAAMKVVLRMGRMRANSQSEGCTFGIRSSTNGKAERGGNYASTL